MAGRLEAMGSEKYRGLTVMQGSHRVWTGNISFDERALIAPLSRKKPTTYFVNSMSDLFHENVADAQIDRIFAAMSLSPQHIFQVLTKRPERMRDYLRSSQDLYARVLHAADEFRTHYRKLCGVPISDPQRIPLRNVWLGTSVENQKTVDERIPLLLQTPAAVRFISAEPLLEEIDLEYPASIYPDGAPMCCNGTDCGCMGMPTEPPMVNELDWVIVGGESGPGARPFELAWARSVIAQCWRWNTPVFMKQIGSRPFYVDPRDGRGHELPHSRASKGGDMDEWPEDLRVRQMPKEKGRL